MISTIDIIKNDLARGGFTAQEERFLRGLDHLTKIGRAVVFRHANTVMLLLHNGPLAAEMHFYTIDNFAIMQQQFQAFYKDAQSIGLKLLTSKTDSLVLPTLAKHAGIPVEVKTLPNGHHEVRLEIS